MDGAIVPTYGNISESAQQCLENLAERFAVVMESCGQAYALEPLLTLSMPRDVITFADLLARAGLTQRAIAVVLNKREATVSDWVRRATYPTLTFAEILQLQVLLNATIEELSLAFDDFSADDARARIEQRLRLME